MKKLDKIKINPETVKKLLKKSLPDKNNSPVKSKFDLKEIKIDNLPESNFKGGRISFVDSMRDINISESAPIIPTQRRSQGLETIVPQAPVEKKDEEKKNIRYEQVGVKETYSTNRGETKRDENLSQGYNPNRKLAIQNELRRTQAPLSETSPILSNSFAMQNQKVTRFTHPEMRENKESMKDYIMERKSFDANQQRSPTDAIRDGDEEVRKYE